MMQLPFSFAMSCKKGTIMIGAFVDDWTRACNAR
ncbi:MAG: hypothetical protein JSC189_000558 [Candidatus Tokpelaia sp. JSC189]|nr:MAG: hypothetical protein JSC189_000558 [Candidatus Tokpelaia sp. JSC189]